MSSPLESVAPIIRSGSKPRAKPRGFSDCKNHMSRTISCHGALHPDCSHYHLAASATPQSPLSSGQDLSSYNRPFGILRSECWTFHQICKGIYTPSKLNVHRYHLFKAAFYPQKTTDLKVLDRSKRLPQIKCFNKMIKVA